MNHLRLARDVLDVARISDIVSAESCGAISLFIGTTRDSFEGKQVLSLEYEAYEPMALKQLELICEDLRRQWPDIVNIAICHRLGSVGIKEASVVIAISSPHRETSLSAIAAAIDDLKKRVPIWKKEMYKEDGATWKQNVEFGEDCNDKTNLFKESVCNIEDPHSLPSQLVQISACETEIKRRIQCFVEKKRKEIDLCNIMDFTDVKQNAIDNCHQTSITQEEKENEAETCARVNSFVVKQEFSKCHLKVRRVENNTGPQTRPDYLNALDKLMVPIERKNEKSHLVVHEKEGNQRCAYSAKTSILQYSAILERLENIEEHLNLPQYKVQNIYQRLKVIEDRLLYLESISPEYVHFLLEKPQRNPESTFESFHDIKPTGLSDYERKLYSVSEIDEIIHRFEARNLDQNSII